MALSEVEGFDCSIVTLLHCYNLSMKLPSHVKKQNILWKLPWLRRQHGTTIFSTIYLRPDIFKELQSSSPSALAIRTLMHEETHVNRIKKTGSFLFGLRYFLLPRFRY